ncbi:hypothetical protein GCM10011571_08400 [Marinithermofilum abyssi]|uniref:Uncharacterized protein n=1 Tax=Marinithermofilum abyssi TaxID=1571185 RepID=A0A8J2YA99_9BACL|nr:hypothetical protein GCM10011571_08400 [Marinithermofilum abyssi]
MAENSIIQQRRHRGNAVEEAGDIRQMSPANQKIQQQRGANGND